MASVPTVNNLYLLNCSQVFMSVYILLNLYATCPSKMSSHSLSTAGKYLQRRSVASVSIGIGEEKLESVPAAPGARRLDEALWGRGSGVADGRGGRAVRRRDLVQG